MQVHFSYQHGSPDPQLDKVLKMHTRKLDQLLVRFSPDLVHLHGLVEFRTPKRGPLCSLHLWLPTARLHAKEQGRDVLATVRASFAHIEEQVKKHKEVLRREGEWKRKRYRGQQIAVREQAGELRVQDRQQLREYLDQVLPQLRMFIGRELRYRRMSNEPLPAQVQEEELLNEVVARALENHQAFSAEAAPFHRLLKEALQVLGGAAGKEPAVARKSRPQAAWEEIGNSKPDPVDLCLAHLPARKRQIYVLHALEGFSYEEAAQVLGQLPNEVEEAFHEVSREVSLTLASNRVGSARKASA